jgi:hypothetical protein
LNKRNRKQALKGEIDRRAVRSGVLPELHVYVMVRHHSDEGGPRGFSPLKVAEMLKEDNYDESLWPSLLEAALHEGVPIEFAPDDARMYRDGRTPLEDIGTWGYREEQLLILSERANKALAPFLPHKFCRPVPLTCKTEPLFGYLLAAFDDLLNDKECDAHRFDDGRIMDISAYAFHTEKLGPAPIFQLTQGTQEILVLQPVVDAVQQHQLTGFRCKRVWPHTSIAPVVKIAVKKLPRMKPKDQSADLKFSTVGTKAPAGFVNKLLGTRLVTDDGKPAKLVAHRLADLSLPSGSIVSADLLFGEGAPFVRTVAPGVYPLTLVAASLQKGTDERIAFAILRFADRPIKVWERAIIRAANKKKSKTTFGVDSGTAGLCDAGAQQVLLDLEDPERTLEKRIVREMAKTYAHTRNWVHLQTRAGSLAIFSSGYGDGEYQSFFGLDRSGEPAALISDFGVIDWPRRPVS